MALRLKTGPASEPVTLAEAKAFARYSRASEDAIFTALITAARQACENEIQRALLPQTWQKSLDEFPDQIELPYPPVVSVTSVKFLDVDGNLQTLSPPSYELDTANEPAWLLPAYGLTWPATRATINAVTVEYVAGYANAAAVPEAIKTWIKLMVNHYFENREASIPGVTLQPIPFLGGLLDPYRVLRLP